MSTKLTPITELTNYELWQLEKYGNTLSEVTVLPSGEIFESNSDEMQRQAEYVSMQSELNLIEQEY